MDTGNSRLPRWVKDHIAKLQQERDDLAEELDRTRTAHAVLCERKGWYTIPGPPITATFPRDFYKLWYLDSSGARPACTLGIGDVLVVGRKADQDVPHCELQVWLILSLKWSKKADNFVWWCPNRSGYTEDIDRAGIYTEAEARETEGEVICDSLAVPMWLAVSVAKRPLLVDASSAHRKTFEAMRDARPSATPDPA